MQLGATLIRFYKSFNYDYLRKSNKSVSEKWPWEVYEDKWFPYVRVPIDSSITTIVGENESGKSCLLTAIEKAVSGAVHQPKDFCRHSEFFTVEEGKSRFPQFGSEWTAVSPEECKLLAETCGLKNKKISSAFRLFRTAPDRATLYFRTKDGFEETPLSTDAATAICDALPVVFRLDADVALPETVPITYLAGPITAAAQYTSSRRLDVAVFDEYARNRTWFGSQESVASNAGAIFSLFKPLENVVDQQETPSAAALRLAHNLVRKIARVDAEALKGLQQALVAGDDAYAESIIRDINRRLDTALNFPKVWAQDRDFRLRVSPRDRDLVFTVHDRTGTQYAFGERSHGLRYFLSYYIQYLSHEPNSCGRSEILLMDEPDAYLSNQGQQDLLRIFESFASPEREGHRPIQVIYVTHSPFLVDKNHADRICVLQKGRGDEGTRVVRDVSRNHYEPLRSAFGAFVAETTFIGNCNLMVEGTSDQILLAGAARHLRTLPGVGRADTLDLNEITIVPAGGAPQVPYLVFLALGRDVDRPTVVALLDSDDEGKAAREVLLSGVGLRGKRKPLLKEKHVLQIGDVHEGRVEMEDLVPIELAVAATREYMEEYCSWDSEACAAITVEAVREFHKGEPASVFGGMRDFVASVDVDVSMQKIGFARAVVKVLHGGGSDGVEEFTARMRALLCRLNSMQRRAARERTVGQVARRFRREKNKFLQDHPHKAAKEDTLVFLETVEEVLDESREADAIRTELNAVRRDFALEDDPAKVVDDYPGLKERLVGIEYAPLREVQEEEREEAIVDGVVASAGSDASED